MEKILQGKIPLVEATMLVYSQEGGELQFPMSNADLQVGDIILLETGKYIPCDTKILSGTVKAESPDKESFTFEPKSIALGGYWIIEGMAKGYVFAKASESQLANI